MTKLQVRSLSLAGSGLALLLSSVASATAPKSVAVDTSSSVLMWTGSKKLGSFHTGEVRLKSGAFLTDGKSVTGGTFEVDLGTISVVDAHDPSMDAKKKNNLKGHLQNEDFFNIAKFPTAKINVTKVEPISGAKAGGPTHRVSAEMELLGNKGPVTFDANISMGKDGKIMAKADQITFDRTKWGLKYGSGNFLKELTADRVINDEVKIALNLSSK